MRVVGVDSKNKIVFIEGRVKDGLELVEYIDRGYRVVKVEKVRAL